jgi:hypothetical protein
VARPRPMLKPVQQHQQQHQQQQQQYQQRLLSQQWRSPRASMS